MQYVIKTHHRSSIYLLLSNSLAHFSILQTSLITTGTRISASILLNLLSSGSPFETKNLRKVYEQPLFELLLILGHHLFSISLIPSHILSYFFSQFILSHQPPLVSHRTPLGLHLPSPFKAIFSHFLLFHLTSPSLPFLHLPSPF